MREHQTKSAHVAEELADILVHAIRMADRLDIDLADAIEQKIESNVVRYPIEEVKGTGRQARLSLAAADS